MLNSELDVVRFWEENDIFQKSIDQNKTGESYVFLDGPPFVTGMPHLGHLSTGFPKDTFPRFWTQKGKYCVRRWGWDCHGLPIENLVQKELNIKDKREIEETVGVQKFNETAKKNITGFDSSWRVTIQRSGRWVDMDDQYRTMDIDYMESVWWGLGQLWQKGLLYKDYRVSMYSPSMGATLSHMEIADDIKYINETLDTPIVRFEVQNNSAKKLLKKIHEEVAFNYSEQLRYKIDVEKRIKTLENLDDSKKRTSLQELLNSGNKEFSGLEWENFQTDLEAEQELVHLQNQLEVIATNIESLENFKKITSDTSPLSLLVWTTTPWTLPVNVALGVGPEVEYSVFYLDQTKELVILAENRAIETISLVLNSEIINTPEIQAKLNSIEDSSEYFETLGVNIIKVASLLGSDLEGLEYNPVFKNIQNVPSYEEKANMYKVYTTEVVTDTDGTGVLHIAPAYGVEDFEIKKSRGLPVLTCLNEYGEVVDTLDESLKPIFGKHFTKTGSLVLDLLEKNKKLFAKQKFTHKYPVFSRDDQKVYYSAQENWFIGETKFLEESIIQNNKINWYPEHLKEGRFQKGLETAPDWCISRNRYWGNPIPIWQTEGQAKKIFVDSLDKLSKLSVNPIYRIINSRNLDPKIYENSKVVIFTDGHNKLPLGISASQYRSKSLSELRKIKDLDMAKFSNVAQSILEEMLELFEKYNTIQTLFNDYEQQLWTTWIYNLHPDSKKVSRNIYFYKKITKDATGDWEPTGNIQLLDLHRPYIDDIILQDEVGNDYFRIEEVMDCWVESGSMPWASYHYPFENKEFVESNIPADYIVEYEGQIRGWFHALHVLSTGIFGKSSFKNVHAHGTLLGYDGKKMSKSKGNYRPTEEYFQKYGSDALRLYFTSSPYFEGESLTLNEKDMQAVFRGSTLLLANSIKYIDYVVSQYSRRELPKTFKHPLNTWWYNYNQNFARELTKNLEEYKLMDAARMIVPYINDLSTWYIRRSKDLLTDYGIEVASCLKQTCKIFAISAASIQPFNTERIWSIIKDVSDPESVHLTRITDFPPITDKQKESLETMEKFRELVSVIHGIRKEKSIRVRQPLYADFEGLELDEMMIDILKKECNLIDKDLSRMEGEIWQTEEYFGVVKVDLVIDTNLAVLGYTRDFERAVQSFRKKQGFRPNQLVSMKWQIADVKDEEILEKVLKNINWSKLNIEVKWVEDLDNLDKSFEVKELVKVLVD